ncbi:phage tail tape measure protein [Vreelandella aquamarina]|uniref:phage tail tape measure protein n=1 Tax=Vreelandella aquamarina TaxID=77097 RepID=UPI003851162A
MAFQSRLELIVDSRSGEQRLRAFENQLNRAEGAGDRLSEGMSVLKMALGAAAAAVGGFSVGRVVTETASFEQSLLKLQVVSGATATQMAALESQSRQLGATSVFSAKQAADAQNFLAMAGLNVNEVLSATPGILQLATAGQMDLASAADLASNVLGGFRLEVGELNRVNDVLAATAARSNTSITQLGDALSYAAPLAATAGISIEETAAAIGVLSDAGLQSSRAGTGLLGFIRQLSNLTPQATTALSNYGLTAAEVNIEQEGLIAVLDRLQKANINTADSFRIFGSEAGPAAQILAAGAVRVNEFTGELELAEGTAAKAALTLGTGLEGSMRSFSSAVGEATLQLGRDSGLSGQLQEVINTSTGVISVYNGMLPQFQEANNLTDLQAQNLQLMATGISLTTGAVGGLTAAYVGLTAATWAAHAAQVAFTRIMRANPLVLAASAAAALGGALYTARNATVEFGQTQASVTDWLQAAWQVSGEIIQESMQGASDYAIGAIESITGPVSSVTTYMWETFKALMTNIGNIAQTTINSMIGYFGTIGDVVGIVTRTMQTLFSDAFDNILNVASGFWQSVQAVFSGDLTFSAFNTALDNLTSGFVGTMAGAADEIGAAFRENMDRNYLGEVFDSLSGGARFVADDFTTLGERISDAAFVARMSRNGFGVVAEGFSEGKTQAQLLQEELEKLNQSLADPASEEAAKAAKTLADNFESLKRTLDPSYSSLMDFWEGIELLNEAIDTTTIEGMTEYNRLVAMLTERYAEATKGSDDAKKALEQLTQQYDSQYQRGVALTQAISDINAAYRRGDIEGQQYGRMIQGVRDEMRELALDADPVAKELARLWEEAGERIDETFADAFTGAFDSFDSFADQLLDGFKRLLGELAYQATLKPIVVGFTQDMQGLMGMGGSQGGGFGNTIGAARSLFSSGSSLLGGGSTAAAAGALYSGASTGLAAGGLYGNAVTGGIASTGIMSSITAGVSAAMPWIAGGLAIDSLLGGGITKAISGLFGGGKTNPHLIVDTRTSNNYGHGSVREGAFGAVGFGQGTRRSNDLFGGIDKEREFLEAVAASDDLLASLARSPAELNRMAEAVQGVRLSASAVEGIMAQLSSRTVAAVSALDGEFGEFVGSLGTDVDTIIARTQSAVAAMDLMGAASENLNLQFDVSASGALRAADSIAQIAGGVEQLASLQDGYYQAYFSDAERAANLQRELTQALAEMGYALPSTRDGFRALVEQQNQLTESGQRNYVLLLQLAGSFDQMQTMLANAGSGVDTFADQLSRLNDEIGSLENDVRQAYQAFERQAFDQQVQLLGMMGDEQAALALQRERELLSIDPLLHETQRFIWAMEDEAAAKERVTQAAQNYRQEIERVRDQLGTALGGINQWIDQRNATGQTPGLNLEAAGEQFARQLVLAESGDRNALQSITQYADQYLAAGEAMFASGGAFQSIQQEVLSALQSLPEQISSEEYLAKEIRAALQDAVNSLPGGIADALHPMFDSIDLDASGLIDWNEFYGAFQGLASDEELRRIFRQLDKDGSGTISKLEALGKTSQGTEDNTQTLEERARDQLSELTGLVSEMTRTTGQFVTLNSGISSLSESINALGVTQAEVARIEKERAAAEKAERERIQRERDAALNQRYSSALDEYEELMRKASNADSSYNSRQQSLSAAERAFQTAQNREGANSGETVRVAQRYSSLQQAQAEINRRRAMGWNNSAETIESYWELQDARRAAQNLVDPTPFLTAAEEMRRLMQSIEQTAKQSGVKLTDLDGSHATGLWNVPFDSYLAELHKGEMVVPAESASLLRDMPDNVMPMASAPLPQFPLLGSQDVSQVMRDMQRTIGRQGQQIAQLLQQVSSNTSQTRDAVMGAGKLQSEKQGQQLSELKKINRNTKVKERV